MFSSPKVQDVEHSRGVQWAELAGLEPELNRLLWRARQIGGAIRSWSEVGDAFAPLRSEMAELVGFSGRRREHPVLGTVGAYDVAYWKLYDAVAGLLPRPGDDAPRGDRDKGRRLLGALPAA